MIHISKFRVRYADTDQMGVVYHTKYLDWFEWARTELLREAGIPYKQLEEKNFFAPVVEAHVNYIKPPKYDDIISVKTTIAKIGNSSLKFEYKLFKDKILLATGYTVHVFVNREFKKIDIPAFVRKALEK